MSGGDSPATKLVVGKHIPPQILLRAADDMPVEIQDLCPSNSRFKLFAFIGNLISDEDWVRVRGVADNLVTLKNRYPQGVFDIFSVVGKSTDVFTYLDLPEILRSHWTWCVTDPSSFISVINSMQCLSRQRGVYSWRNSV